MSTRSLLLAAAVLAAPAFAPSVQAQATLGLKAGLNVSDFTGDDAPDNTDPRLGFSGGVFATLPIGYSGLYVQPEVLYSMKGVTDDDDLGTSNGFTVAVDYIEVPFVLGYAVPVTETGLAIGAYAGPALGFKVNERGSARSGNTTVSTDSDIFKDTDVSAVVGLTVGAGAFGIDGRYTVGLTDALDDSNADLRNNAFTIGATYTFGGRNTARRPGRRY